MRGYAVGLTSALLAVAVGDWSTFKEFLTIYHGCYLLTNLNRLTRSLNRAHEELTSTQDPPLVRKLL
jgi:hypothetical protein